MNERTNEGKTEKIPSNQHTNAASTRKKKKRKQTCSLFIGIYYANIIFPAIDMSTAVVKQYMMRMKNTQIAALQPVQ